jgi:uncharacterized membrane protein
VTHLERERIQRAIAAAESETTGRVAVRIVEDADVDAFEHAKTEFVRAGLHQTKHRNAALVLVAPKARRFAVLGDRDLHAHVGDAFWNNVAAEMQPYFARNELVEAILHGVERIGSEFHAHFSASEA